MARHTFGQSLTDWGMTVAADDHVLVAGGVTVTFWSAATGGAQYDDLLDGAANPVSSIVSADGSGVFPKGTIPQFQGPDGVATMWADAGGGARYLMTATDLGNQVVSTALAIEQANIDIAALQAALASRLPAILWDQATSAYPARTPDLAGLRVQWVGPAMPPVDVLHAVAGDMWAKTVV